MPLPSFSNLMLFSSEQINALAGTMADAPEKALESKILHAEAALRTLAARQEHMMEAYCAVATACEAIESAGNVQDPLSGHLFMDLLPAYRSTSAIRKALRAISRKDPIAAYELLNEALDEQRRPYLALYGLLYGAIASGFPAFLRQHEEGLGGRYIDHVSEATIAYASGICAPRVHSGRLAHAAPSLRFMLEEPEARQYGLQALLRARRLLARLENLASAGNARDPVESALSAADFPYLFSDSFPEAKRRRQHPVALDSLGWDALDTYVKDVCNFAYRKGRKFMDKSQRLEAKLEAVAKQQDPAAMLEAHQLRIAMLSRFPTPMNLILFSGFLHSFRWIGEMRNASRIRFEEDVPDPCSTSCFFRDGKPGPMHAWFERYGRDTSTHLLYLMHSDGNMLSFDLQNICFDVECEGKRCLLVDGAIGQYWSGLFAGYHDVDLSLDTIHQKNLEGLQAFASERGYAALLVNTSHSDSHQSTHDFARYAAQASGHQGDRFENGLLKNAGNWAFKSQRIGGVREFSLGPALLRNHADGFAYTHHVKKAWRLGTDETYAESWHPWHAHNGKERPFITSGEGFIRALEIPVPIDRIGHAKRFSSRRKG